MSKQAVPRFGMSIRETLSEGINLEVILQQDKGAAIQILRVLAHV